MRASLPEDAVLPPPRGGTRPGTLTISTRLWGSGECPVVPFAEESPQETHRLGRVHASEECAEVLAEKPRRRSVRLEIHAVVFNNPRRGVDSNRVSFD